MDVLAAPFHGSIVAAPTPSAPAPEVQALQRAATMLCGANRPLLILGGGAVNAADQAKAFAQAAS